MVGGPRRKPRPEEDGDAWHQKVKGGKPVVVVPKGGQPGEASAITVMDPPATGELYDPSIQDAETLCLEDEQGNKREPGWGTINKGWEDEEEEQFPLTNTQEIYDDDVVEEEDLDETGVREPEAPHDPMDLADTIVDMPDEDIDFDEDDEELAATRPHEVVVQRPPPECDEVVVQPPLPEDDEEGEQPTLESDDDLDLDELFSGQGLGDEIVELTHVAMEYYDQKLFRSVITVGSPAFTHMKHPAVDVLFRLRFMLEILPWIPYSPFAKLGALMPGLLLKTVGRVVSNPEQMDPAHVRMLAWNVPSDLPANLMRQFAEWYGGEGGFSRTDGLLDYYNHLDRITAPVLVIAGAGDRLTPVADLRFVFEAISSEDKRFLICGKEQGFSLDYGHIDTILGKNARREVYPHMAEWIESH